MPKSRKPLPDGTCERQNTSLQSELTKIDPALTGITEQPGDTVLCRPCSQFAGKVATFQRSGLSRHLQSAQHRDSVEKYSDQQAREQERMTTHSERDLGPATMNTAPVNLGQQDTDPITAGPSLPRDPFAFVTTVDGRMYDHHCEPIVIPAGRRETDRERLEQELERLMATELLERPGSSWLDNIITGSVEERDGPTRTNADIQHDLAGKGLVLLWWRDSVLTHLTCALVYSMFRH